MSIQNVSTAAAVEYYARVNSMQARNKQQAAALEEAAAKVNTKLAVFKLSGMFDKMYSKDKEGSAFHSFSVNALRDLVNSYNRLNDFSISSSSLSDEGKALLNNVKDLLGGSKASTFEELGLKLDPHSGAMVFDERLFAEKLASDPSAVRGALLSPGMLGPILQNTISSMLSKPATAYFNSSFSIKV